MQRFCTLIIYLIALSSTIFKKNILWTIKLDKCFINVSMSYEYGKFIFIDIFYPVTINIKYRTLYGSPNICPNIQRNIFETSNWFFSILWNWFIQKRRKFSKNLLLYSCVSKNIKFMKRKENHSVEKFKTFNKRIVQRII